MSSFRPILEARGSAGSSGCVSASQPDAGGPGVPPAVAPILPNLEGVGHAAARNRRHGGRGGRGPPGTPLTPKGADHETARHLRPRDLGPGAAPGDRHRPDRPARPPRPAEEVKSMGQPPRFKPYLAGRARLEPRGEDATGGYGVVGALQGPDRAPVSGGLGLAVEGYSAGPGGAVGRGRPPLRHQPAPLPRPRLGLQLPRERQGGLHPRLHPLLPPGRPLRARRQLPHRVDPGPEQLLATSASSSPSSPTWGGPGRGGQHVALPKPPPSPASSLPSESLRRPRGHAARRALAGRQRQPLHRRGRRRATSAAMDKFRGRLQELQAAFNETDDEHPDGHTFVAGEPALPRGDRPGLRRRGGPGAAGREVADLAREILLDEVLLPYDRLIGRFKEPDTLPGARGPGPPALRDGPRRPRGRSSREQRGDGPGHVRPPAGPHRGRAARIRGALGRRRAQGVAAPDPRGAGRGPRQPGGAERAHRAGPRAALRAGATRSSPPPPPASRSSWCGRSAPPRTTTSSGSTTTRAGWTASPTRSPTGCRVEYLKTLTRHVRAYDETGRMPTFMIFHTQFFYDGSESRLFLTLLENPLHHRLKLGKEHRDMEREGPERPRRSCARRWPARSGCRPRPGRRGRRLDPGRGQGPRERHLSRRPVLPHRASWWSCSPSPPTA